MFLVIWGGQQPNLLTEGSILHHDIQHNLGDCRRSINIKQAYVLEL